MLETRPWGFSLVFLRVWLMKSQFQLVLEIPHAFVSCRRWCSSILSFLRTIRGTKRHFIYFFHWVRDQFVGKNFIFNCPHRLFFVLFIRNFRVYKNVSMYEIDLLKKTASRLFCFLGRNLLFKVFRDPNPIKTFHGREKYLARSRAKNDLDICSSYFPDLSCGEKIGRWTGEYSEREKSSKKHELIFFSILLESDRKMGLNTGAKLRVFLHSEMHLCWYVIACENCVIFAPLATNTVSLSRSIVQQFFHRFFEAFSPVFFFFSTFLDSFLYQAFLSLTKNLRECKGWK